MFQKIMQLVSGLCFINIRQPENKHNILLNIRCLASTSEFGVCEWDTEKPFRIWCFQKLIMPETTLLFSKTCTVLGQAHEFTENQVKLCINDEAVQSINSKAT